MVGIRRMGRPLRDEIMTGCKVWIGVYIPQYGCGRYGVGESYFARNDWFGEQSAASRNLAERGNKGTD
jgi:hypothetical protein